MKRKLESEKEEFNRKDYNNQKAILHFMIDKSNEGYVCDSCERAYHKRYCNLCRWLINHDDVPNLYRKINETFDRKLVIA